MKNRKIFTIVAAIILICGAVLTTFLIISQTNGKFELPAENYGAGEIREITANEYDQMIAAKKTFIVLAHDPECPVNMPLTGMSEYFAREHNLTIFGLLTDEFRDSSLSKTITFKPSLAIIKNGKIVTFLRADSDEDLPIYQSDEELENWLEKYVIFADN